MAIISPSHSNSSHSPVSVGHRIDKWDPEDVAAWEAGGKNIARRNLVGSILAEHIGFSVWSVWSVMVLFMPTAVYHIDAAGKFFLVAVPTLVGAVLRLPYTFATATFGGRNWTIISALALAVPMTLTLYFISRPETSYTMFMIVAAFAGLGGGNFASSMTNINAFYPQRLKGWALGLNAGGGNIGVPAIQLIGLLVIATWGNRSPQIVCAVYLVLIGIAAVIAALYMDNLTDQKTGARSLIDVLKFRDSWIISFLYIGTFGSFIGFSFAFGQILQLNFLAGLTNGAPATAAMQATAALHAAQIAFIGPLLGSLSRPLGGRLADKIGGGRITLYSFVAMMAAAGILVVAGTVDDSTPGGREHRPHDRLRRRIHPAVRHLRNRQRVRLQNDPGHLRGESRSAAPPRHTHRHRLVTHDVRSTDRHRRRRRRPRRSRHQPRPARLVPRGTQVGHHSILGVRRVLHPLRRDHLDGVPAATDHIDTLTGRHPHACCLKNNLRDVRERHPTHGTPFSRTNPGLGASRPACGSTHSRQRFSALGAASTDGAAYPLASSSTAGTVRPLEHIEKEIYEHENVQTDGRRCHDHRVDGNRRRYRPRGSRTGTCRRGGVEPHPQR